MESKDLLTLLPFDLIVRILIICTWKETVNVIRSLSKKFKSLVDDIPSIVISFWLMVEFQLPEPIDGNWNIFKLHYTFRKKPFKYMDCKIPDSDSRHWVGLVSHHTRLYGEKKFFGRYTIDGVYGETFGSKWGCACASIKIIFTRIRFHPMERIVFYSWDDNIPVKIRQYINEEFGGCVGISHYPIHHPENYTEVTEYTFINGCTFEMYSGPECLVNGINIPKELADKQKNSGRSFHTTIFIDQWVAYKSDVLDKLWNGTALHSAINIVWYLSGHRMNHFYEAGESWIKANLPVAQWHVPQLEKNIAKVRDLVDIVEYLKLDRIPKVRWNTQS